MASKKRDLLEVLKLELEFLKGGGYRKWSSWRPNSSSRILRRA